MTTAGLLLAAGTSRRFGDANKLCAHLHGKPLISYAANALAAVGPDHLLAVTRDDEVAELLAGFAIVRPQEAAPEQSDSLRAGVARAQMLGSARVVVVLGDTPFVTSALIRKVISRSTSEVPAAVTDGHRPRPPACFPAACFADLMAQSGDRGATTLLGALPPAALVNASNSELCDIDTPAALALAHNKLLRQIT